MADRTVKDLADRIATIAVDFDGVINSYTSGFSGSEIPDPPVKGAIEWLEEMTKVCKILIHTARLEYEEEEGQPPQEQLIRDWLIKWGLSDEALGKLRFVTKPVATIYLDDRAVRFTGKNFPTEERIRTHTTWNGPSNKEYRKPLPCTQGGCWFCNMDGCNAFDHEWDTFIHVECLIEALKKEPNHPEATSMKYLLPPEDRMAIESITEPAHAGDEGAGS
jgi:hypothetical protein